MRGCDVDSRWRDSVAAGVAQIGLKRPEAVNAFDLDTTREFASAVERAAGEDLRPRRLDPEARWTDLVGVSPQAPAR